MANDARLTAGLNAYSPTGQELTIKCSRIETPRQFERTTQINDRKPGSSPKLNPEKNEHGRAPNYRLYLFRSV